MSATETRHQESGPLARAYLDHYDGLQRFINRRVAEKELAADIAHDVFAELMSAWPRLDLSRPILPWLQVVARRRILDEIRRRRARMRLVEGVGPLLCGVTPAPLADAIALIENLTDAEKAIVYRRVFLDQSFDEIACALHASQGACRMRYLRALRSLRGSTLMARLVSDEEQLD